MKKLNYSIFVILLILFTGFITSCKKKSVKQEAFTPRLDTSTSCSIEIAGNYKNFEALETEIDRFNEFYPDVDITYFSLDNYNNTIINSLAGNDAPDIFMAFQWMRDKPMYNALFDKCQNMAEKEKLGFDLSTIKKSLIYKKSDGSIPMIPVFGFTNGMLINEDIFKKHGIKIPVTYSQLIEACTKLQELGYKNPILSYDSPTSIFPSLVYTNFCNQLAKNPKAISMLNELNPEAGEYMRPCLEWTKNFFELGFIDFDECAKINNNYNAVIMRFFEGDVPMMLGSADVASGTFKREKLSKDYEENPFTYSFHIFPSSDKSFDFLFSSSIDFCVNKDSNNLEAVNEFIRFLIRTEELNNLAQIKRLVTCSTDYSFDEMFSALQNANPIYQYETGIMDNTFTQLRNACYEVAKGNMSIDEAVAAYGKIKSQ